MNDEFLSEQIAQRIRVAVEEMRNCPDISYGAVALKVQDYYRQNQPEMEVHLRFSSLRDLRQAARKVLSRAHDIIERVASVVDDQTEDMFAEFLQERYPVPGRSHKDPIYRKRELMSVEEVDLVCDGMHRRGRALQRHADALRSWNRSRITSDAA